MIKYNLICKCGHTFESWFATSNEFDKLRKKKLVTCLFCNSTNVKKTIMAPNLSNSAKKSNKDINNENHIRNKLIEFRRFVEKMTDLGPIFWSEKYNYMDHNHKHGYSG